MRTSADSDHKSLRDASIVPKNMLCFAQKSFKSRIRSEIIDFNNLRITRFVSPLKALTIELYCEELGSDLKRVGFCNILSSHLKDSNGIISMPLNGVNGKIVAQMQCITTSVSQTIFKT